MRLIVLVLLITFSQVSAYNNVDSLGFISPVDHQIRLTGNFMELRPNHFHAGIDIKSTNGQIGDAIKVVQDGIVSRIKVSSGGYGNVLYIDHPNGYTSVYAHLSIFDPQLEAYVKEMQYRLESFELDIYLSDDKFSFIQGDKIGEMGNSGRSFGPHLHFELRKTESEHPVNPEALGIGPEDNHAPTLQSLHLHHLSEQEEVLSKTIKYFNPKQKGYVLYSDTLDTKAPIVGMGLQMFDRMDGSWNKNGIYGFELEVEEQKTFAWRADEFSFDETRFINGFWDYERKTEHGQKVYLFYKTSCNPFSYYEVDANGLIRLELGESKRVKLKVFDIHENTSEVYFVVRRVAKESGFVSEGNLMTCDTSHNIKAGGFRVRFDEQNFFQPIRIDVQMGSETLRGKATPFIQLGTKAYPVNGYYKVTHSIVDSEPEKWNLVKLNSKGQMKQFAADTVSGKLLFRLDELGKFYLVKDEKAPELVPISFSKNRNSPWKVTMTDNMIPDGRTQDIKYEARLNGNWIRMAYDAKNDLLLFSDKEWLKSGLNTFILMAKDNCGNVRKYERFVHM